MYLTRSFRFDNKIACVANMILSAFKGETKRVVGIPRDHAKPKWNPQQYTVIARTNAAVFDRAVQLYKTHTLGFAGGVQGYRLGGLKDVANLYAGDHDRVSDCYIKGFDTYSNLRIYAEAVEDIELLGICKVVESYGGSLPTLVEVISQRAVDPKNAQVTLTTAHKAKGLQWPNVLLMGDFLDLVEDGDLIKPSEADPDEFNLIYVAITRTIVNLRFDKESTLPLFIQLLQKKARHLIYKDDSLKPGCAC